MSDLQLPLGIGQLEVWLRTLIERIRLKPAESFAVATSVAFAYFIVKKFSTASFYHNIDGPDSGSFILGT